MPNLWDPFTYKNLVMGLVVHFERQKRLPLQEMENEKVEGPGIYTLYYEGEFSVYKPIADGKLPIYTGKAVPPGARKGSALDVDHPALRKRLREHSKSIEEAGNLDVKDFSFRYLAVMPVWIVFTEQGLISHYQPVWNSCLEGFGKHNQGGRRSTTVRSWWDTLHPGRIGTDNETQTKTIDEASKRVRDFLQVCTSRSPPDGSGE